MLISESFVAYRDMLVGRLIGAGLLPADHSLEIPDLPPELIPRTSDLLPPTPRTPRLALPPFLVVPVRLLEQVDVSDPEQVVYHWLPATGHAGAYWVRGVVMVLGLAHMPPEEELKRTHIGYGEAACLIAQFPELGSCRTRQTTYPTLQAYHNRSSRRIMLSERSHEGNNMYHFVTFLREGARLYAPSSVLSVRHPVPPVAA